MKIIALFISLLGTLTIAQRGHDRSIQIFNESGHRVEVYWVHVETEERVAQSESPIFNGASLNLNSYIGHTFEVRELPSKRTNECGGKDKECRSAYLTVNENDDQIYWVRKGMEIEFTDNIKLARKSALDLMGTCEERAIEKAKLPGVNASQIIFDLKDCVEHSVTTKLTEANEEIAFQAKVRTDMSDLLENYTCADLELPTTKAEDTMQWHYHDRITRDVHVMHTREASKIHLIENFVSEEECLAMEQAAEKRLHKATTASGDGGSHYSDARKAMQAGIPVPWDKEAEGNPIAVLSRRVFDYTNYATGFGLEEFGQEDLMSIQYFGRGDDDEAPDRYTPHCDGECKGMPHKEGGRVATMVMYCTIPEKGGATNFMNSGVHINAVKGNAVFFSYMDPDTLVMDKGFTQHSGCPVTQGIKRIVTQWMRYGVSSETPWTAFNTLGIKHSDAQDD